MGPTQRWPCIRRCAPLLTFRLALQQFPLIQQVLLSCGQRRNGALQLLKCSLIWSLSKQLLLLFLLQLLQSLLDSPQPLFHPLQVSRALGQHSATAILQICDCQPAALFDLSACRGVPERVADWHSGRQGPVSAT